jgi:predicted RNA methylase
MGEYEKLQAQKRAIMAAEKYRNDRSVVARLMHYIQHDYLCAVREVKGGGCTCGLIPLLDDIQGTASAAQKEGAP